MPKLIGDFDERLKSLHVSVGSFLRVLKPIAFSRIESASTLGNGKLKLGELLGINGGMMMMMMEGGRSKRSINLFLGCE